MIAGDRMVIGCDEQDLIPDVMTGRLVTPDRDDRDHGDVDRSEE